jgi:hypothetical protein
MRFINWYIGKLHLRATRDSTLANRPEAEELLRNKLRPMEGVWIAHIPPE